MRSVSSCLGSFLPQRVAIFPLDWHIKRLHYRGNKTGEGKKKDTPGITSFSAEAILQSDWCILFTRIDKAIFKKTTTQQRLKNPSSAISLCQIEGHQNRPCLCSILFSHHRRNPFLNIRTEKHLCDADVTDLPGLPLTKAKVSLLGPHNGHSTKSLRSSGRGNNVIFCLRIIKTEFCRKPDRQNPLEVNAPGGFWV